MTRLLKYTTLPIIVSGIIFYLCCLIPKDNIPDADNFFEHFDKFVHFMMFLGLAGSASFSYIFFNKGQIIILRMLIFAVLLPIIYGGAIEIIQHYWFEGRSGDWYDFLADTLGALTAIPFAFLFRRFMLKQHLKEII